MLNSFVLTVAGRYFKAKKNERFVSFVSGFSLIGVMLGVAALIVVMSVMHGFHIELTRNIIGLNGDISITSISRSITNYPQVLQNIETTGRTKHLVPSVTGQALAIGTRTNSGALIKGIELTDLKYKPQILANVMAGDFAHFTGKNVIALGRELAYILGVSVGSKIKLVSSTTIPTALGSIPRSKEFEVVAIFASGMYDYDSATILMPLNAAQLFLGLEDNINLIEVHSIDSDRSGVFAKEIQNILGSDYRATSWQVSNAQFLHALAVERVAMFTILSLIIVVAAFNIISTLFMLVKDKTRDIAILRTMGATQRQIMMIFVCNGMFIGLIGTTLGVLLGAGFAYNIETIRQYLQQLTGVPLFEAALYFLYTLPSHVEPSNVLLVASFALVLCLCGTIYPAYKASRLDPIEAMRYE